MGPVSNWKVWSTALLCLQGCVWPWVEKIRLLESTQHVLSHSSETTSCCTEKGRVLDVRILRTASGKIIFIQFECLIHNHFVQVGYKEIRYLCGAQALQAWCDFGSLLPSNPALSGCSRCMHSVLGEVKFVTGIWVCFLFDPAQVQPQNRYRIIGWMSTSHWNGTVFRSGEAMDDDSSSPDSDIAIFTIDQQIQDLREQINNQICFDLEAEFSASVRLVEEICKLRMLEREKAIEQRKIDSLQRSNMRALAATLQALPSGHPLPGPSYAFLQESPQM